MKKSFVLLILLIGSFSTVMGGNSKVRFGMDEYFSLEKGEKELERTDRATKDYIEKMIPAKGEIALNKIIKLSDGSNLFIGMALNNKLDEIVGLYRDDSSTTIIDNTTFSKDKKDVISFFYKKNEMFFNVFAYTSGLLMTPVVLTVQGTDSTTINKYLTNEKYFYDKVEYK